MTKCDQRLDTKEEPTVRHEELSVGHVIPTRDREMVMASIYCNMVTLFETRTSVPGLDAHHTHRTPEYPTPPPPLGDWALDTDGLAPVSNDTVNLAAHYMS